MIKPQPQWSYLIGAAIIGGIAWWLEPEGKVIPNAAPVTEELLGLVGANLEQVAAFTGGVFAGAAALAVGGAEWSRAWGRVESMLTIACLLCGALGYWGMLVAQAALQEMAAAGALSLDAPRLRYGLALQYYSTLVGVVCLGLLFVRMIDGRRSDPKS